MNRIKTISLACLFSLLAPFSFGNTLVSGSGNYEKLTVAFTFSMPPYLSVDKQSGIERDIIVSALNEASYNNIQIENVHYLRAIELAKKGKVDLIVSNRSNTTYSLAIPNITESNRTLDYVDCAISLKSRNLSLSRISDYHNKRIWAFKSAHVVLGADFEKMAKNNPNYSEDFDQLKQIDMLAMKRIDVAISDRNIFSEKLKSHPQYNHLTFEFNEIGKPTPRVIRSTNKILIERFNHSLTKMHENGTYKKILENYKEQYSSHCNN